MAEVPNVEEAEDLSFDLAFEAALTGEVPPVEEPAAEPEPLPEPEASSEPEPPPEPPAAPEPPKAEEPPPPPKPQPQPEPPPQEPPQPVEVYTPTDEEAQQLEAVRTEFPEVAAAMAVYEKVMASKFEKALAEKLSEVHAYYAPIVATTQRVAQNEHEATILKAHADAFSIVDDVSKWVGTQPTILRNAYANVLQNGSAAEVVELLDVYKQAVKPPAAPPPEPPKVDEEKERKLQALEGVRHRNTSERAALDPDDFDGAFDKFAAKA